PPYPTRRSSDLPAGRLPVPGRGEGRRRRRVLRPPQGGQVHGVRAGARTPHPDQGGGRRGRGREGRGAQQGRGAARQGEGRRRLRDRKSTRLNSSRLGGEG